MIRKASSIFIATIIFAVAATAHAGSGGATDIRVWLEGETHDVYSDVDDVVLYVRAARSCYATVYVVDTGSYEAVSGESNSERMPPFHQLDLRLDKRWIFDNWMLTAYLDVQNVYNRANPVAITYNYDSTEQGVRQSLPIIPIVGIKGEF